MAIAITPEMTQALLLSVTMLVLFYFLFLIRFGVGFRNLREIHKAVMGRNKGWGIVYMYYPTGVRTRTAVHFKGQDFIEPMGVGKGQYKVNNKLLLSSRDEFGLNYLSYKAGDAEPIDPVTGLMTVTSAELLEETMSLNLRAKNTLGDFWEKFKWYFLIGAVVLVIIVGGLLYLNYHTQELMVQQAKELTRPVFANLTAIE